MRGHVVARRVEGVVHDRLGGRDRRRRRRTRPAALRRSAGTADTHTPWACGIAHALIDDLHGREVELDVRRGRAGTDAGEAAGLGEVGGERARLASLRTPRSAAGSSASSRLSGSGVVHTSWVAAWSDRFSPDRGLVEQHLDLAHRRCSAGPIPESISSCGEL